MKVDQAKNRSVRDQETKATEVDPCGSDLSSPLPKKQAQTQPRKRWGLSGFELLGLIILASATFWICGLPPANPTERFDWLFDRSYERVQTPLRALSMLLIFMYILVIRNCREGVLHDIFTGSAVVNGVSILGFHPESSAKEADMQKGDVIFEYGSERDLTIEKLSAIMAKREHEAVEVCVVFMRGRQQYSQTLPSGPLGISAMNVTVTVPIKSE
jgi:hypothetical protein